MALLQAVLPESIPQAIWACRVPSKPVYRASREMEENADGTTTLGGKSLRDGNQTTSEDVRQQPARFWKWWRICRRIGNTTTSTQRNEQPSSNHSKLRSNRSRAVRAARSGQQIRIKATDISPSRSLNITAPNQSHGHDRASEHGIWTPRNGISPQQIDLAAWRAAHGSRSQYDALPPQLHHFA